MKLNFKNITCIFLGCFVLAACEKPDEKVYIEYVDFVDYPLMGIDQNKNLSQAYLVSGTENQFCNSINNWIKSRQEIYKRRFEKQTFNRLYLTFYKKEKILAPENPFIEDDFEYDAHEYKIAHFMIEKDGFIQMGCEGSNPQPDYKMNKS